MSTKPKTILVLAYSISPVRGSEYAVGWNYVTHMSGSHRLIVLYGLAGAHMGDVEEMAGVDPAQFANPVTFVPVLPDRLARAANYLNRTGALPYSFYFAYRRWHRQAAAVARRLIETEQVDVIHYLCPIGYREPGYLWKLDKPYIWGPIGGMRGRPAQLFYSLDRKLGLVTYVRNFVNALQFRLNPRLAKAIRRADVLLANTSENHELIRDVYGRDAIVFPENGVTSASPAPRPDPAGPLQIIWAGSIEPRKAIEILLRALAPLTQLPWSLKVVGDGPLGDAMKALAAELGIADRITWAGKIPREQVMQAFAQAHVHVVTSLAEGHPTIIWEAMSVGTPTIAFELCGMRDSLCGDCGVKIPVTDIDRMQAQLSAELSALIHDPARRLALAEGAAACGERAHWSHRRGFWNNLYDQAIEHWARKRR